MMTVKELIAELEKMPSDATVRIATAAAIQHGIQYGTAHSVGAVEEVAPYVVLGVAR